MSSTVSLASAAQASTARWDLFPIASEKAETRERVEALAGEIFSCNDLFELIFSKIAPPLDQCPIYLTGFKVAMELNHGFHKLVEKTLRNNIKEILIFFQDQDRDVDSYVREQLKLDLKTRVGCDHYVRCCNGFYAGLLKKWKKDIGGYGAFEGSDATYNLSEIRERVIRYSEYEFCNAARESLRRYSATFSEDVIAATAIPELEEFMRDPTALQNWVEANKTRLAGLTTLDFSFKLHCIPPQISAFTGLKTIHFRFAGLFLTSLPPELLGLEKLKETTESAGFELNLSETFKKTDTYSTLLERGLLPVPKTSRNLVITVVALLAIAGLLFVCYSARCEEVRRSFSKWRKNMSKDKDL